MAAWAAAGSGAGVASISVGTRHARAQQAHHPERQPPAQLAVHRDQRSRSAAATSKTIRKTWRAVRVRSGRFQICSSRSRAHAAARHGAAPRPVRQGRPIHGGRPVFRHDPRALRRRGQPHRVRVQRGHVHGDARRLRRREFAVVAEPEAVRQGPVVRLRERREAGSRSSSRWPRPS
jgi:hypothetical protein